MRSRAKNLHARKACPGNLPEQLASQLPRNKKIRRYQSLHCLCALSDLCGEFLSSVAYCRTFVPRVRRSQSVAALRVNPNRIHQSISPPQFHPKPPPLPPLLCPSGKLSFHPPPVRQPLDT